MLDFRFSIINFQRIRIFLCKLGYATELRELRGKNELNGNHG